MEKYVILKIDKHNKSCEDISSVSKIRYMFLILMKIFFEKNGLEQFKDYWYGKGADADLGHGDAFMLDEPSGFIYYYDYFIAQDLWLEWKRQLSYEEKMRMIENSDDGPFIVDLIRDGIIPYYSTMHKNNLFVVYEKWDKYYQDPHINYMVWYEDKNDWVHLEGFQTEEQARKFVERN